MISIITIFIVLYIKIVFGVINKNSNFEFQGPSYNVTINDELISANVGSIKQVKLIPFLLNYNSEHGVTTEGKEECKIELGNQIVLGITPFRCYSTVMGSKHVAACLHDNSHMILENLETKEYSIFAMKITGGSTYAFTSHKVYDGEFRSNITDLVKNKAKYQILIKVKYKNILSEIYVNLDII